MSNLLKEIRAAFGDVEAAPYTVVVQRGGYEERVYPARRWACTSMSGPSRHALVAPMFRRLFSYVSGRNEPNIRMDMTTPVTTLVEPASEEERRAGQMAVGDEEERCDVTDNAAYTTSTTTTCSFPPPTYTMGLFIPQAHQDAPPTTADKMIFIEYRPRLRVLARQFSGYLNDEVVERELAGLRKAITSNQEDDHVDLERYYVVGYDPPFKLLGRRNEVWVVKKVSEEVTKEANGSDDFVMVERGKGGRAVVVNGGISKEVVVEEEVVVADCVVGKANGDAVVREDAN